MLGVFEAIPNCLLHFGGLRIADNTARLQNAKDTAESELLIMVHTLTLLRRPCAPQASRWSIRPGPRKEAHPASQDGEECHA